MSIINKVKDDSERSGILTWEIKIESPNTLCLCVSAEDGSSYYVLTVDEEGRARRVAGVAQDIGLSVDKHGRILIHD